MDATAMDYVNLGFAWFLVLMSIWGYVAIARNAGQRMIFWLFFGLAWVLFGLSDILNLGGTSGSAWYMTALHAGGYALIVIALVSLMVHIVDRENL